MYKIKSKKRGKNIMKHHSQFKNVFYLGTSLQANSPYIVQLSYRLQDMETCYGKDKLAGIAGRMLKLAKDNQLDRLTYNKANLLNVHIANLINTFGIEDFEEVFNLHYYNYKEHKKGRQSYV